MSRTPTSGTNADATATPMYDDLWKPSAKSTSTSVEIVAATCSPTSASTRDSRIASQPHGNMPNSNAVAPTAMRSREPRRRRGRYEVVHEDLAVVLVDVDDERVGRERRRKHDKGAPACVDVARAARRKGNGAKASRPWPCERAEHDEEVWDDT